LLPWTEYFLGTLIAACGDFESRVGALTSARGAKRQMVLDAIAHSYGTFTVADLQEACPTVSLDFIRLILRHQRLDGLLECLDKGPKAKWRRV
jgi:hypothetical protein